MIELSHFSKLYKHFSAVTDVSLVCKPGCITGLLGENGAGKTTILKAVAGWHCASSGKLLVHGVNAAENPVAVRSLVGFVPESPVFPAEYTVREFLLMTARIHLLPSPERALSDVAELCSISDILSKKIRTLSKGYRERLAFANALIYNPPVLVLDEPASGLDPAQIVRMRALVKELAKTHTILLSTHLMQEVDILCDFICILHKGQSVAQGSAEEIIRKSGKKSLEEAFLQLTQNFSFDRQTAQGDQTAQGAAE